MRGEIALKKCKKCRAGLGKREGKRPGGAARKEGAAKRAQGRRAKRHSPGISGAPQKDAGQGKL